jgi:hypothetical protein
MFRVNVTTSTIHITRGDTGTLNIDLVDAEGNIYTPQSGDSLKLRIANSSNIIVCTLDAIIDTDAGTNTFRFLPEDTKGLIPGNYHYEVELITANNEHYTVIEYKVFEIGKEIEQNDG